MEQIDFGSSEKLNKISQYTPEELVRENQLLHSELSKAIKEVYRLKYQHLTDEQLDLVLQEHLAELKQEIYGVNRRLAP